MTIRDRGAIHNKARESLANAKGDPKKILLIYLGIVTALSVVVAVFSVVLSNRIDETGGLSNMGLRSVLSTAKTVLPIVQSLVLMGLKVGYNTMTMRIARGESVSEQTLFGGFRRFFPLLRAEILLGFLYMAAGMFAAYAGAYLFVMLPVSKVFQDIVTPLMESATTLGGAITLDEATMAAVVDAMMPMLWIFLGLFLLLFIPMKYRYRMVIYRLIDQPRPGALRAIHESRIMMHRNRFALLKLDLSFWWFYLLQLLITVVCYGDVILALVGITLPWSAAVSYLVLLGLSLVLQLVVYYFFMNRVSVTYATAYETLLPQLNPQANSETPQMSTNVPWQNQY